jgi:hypothetical protein
MTPTLPIDKARLFARAATRLNHLRPGDNGFPCQVYNSLSEGDEADVALAEAFLAMFPNILNWDEKGNWTGNVRYEDGWTA